MLAAYVTFPMPSTLRRWVGRFFGVRQDEKRTPDLIERVENFGLQQGVSNCSEAKPENHSTLLAALPDSEQGYVDELSALFVHKKRHQSPERTSQAASEVAHLSTVPSTIDHLIERYSPPLVTKWYPFSGHN